MEVRTAPMKAKPSGVKVFFSYSHRDERFRVEIMKHLSWLRRSGLVQEWHDRDINPGEEFSARIDRELHSADVILVLVSPDFMASDYAYTKEMERALNRHKKGDARVVPIILRPVEWHESPLGKLLAIPRDGRPVTTWGDRDVALLDIAKGVRRVVEEVCSSRASVCGRRIPLEIER
jgi:hypothetical protein